MSPDRDFVLTLDEALDALRQGNRIRSVLAHYSDDAERLSPLLETAQTVIQTPHPEPSRDAAITSKARMMRVLGEKKTTGLRHKEDILDDLGAEFQREHGKGLIVAVLTLALVFILLSTFSVFTIESLPGSWLYPVKLTLQDTHILLTVDPETKQERIDFYNQLRLQDLRAAVEQERILEADAQATMTAMPTPAPTAANTDQSPSDH